MYMCASCSRSAGVSSMSLAELKSSDVQMRSRMSRFSMFLIMMDVTGSCKS